MDRPATLQGVSRFPVHDCSIAPAWRGALRRRRRSGGLRWMLGVSYMHVTFLAVVVLALVALVAVAQGVLHARRTVLHLVADGVGPVAADLLAADAPGDAFAAFLSRPISLRDDLDRPSLLLPREPSGYAIVTDADGNVWFDGRSDAAAAPASAGTPVLARSDRRQVAGVLGLDVERVRTGLARTSLATPLHGADGEVVGALLQVATLLPASPGLVALAVGTLPVATLLAILIGTTFGLTASRPLARRLENLTAAADAWSRGDFRRSIHDPNRDELARATQRLDRMAMQLSDLLRVRQAMAKAHERTRLAGELHDSVKQQLFAASLLLSTARASVPREAVGHVEAASELIEEAKRELSTLIHELRPVAIQGRPVDEALRALAESRPAGTAPVLRLHLVPDQRASPEAGAALYRIAQEGLSNVARHAHASHVDLTLERVGDDLVLTVADDGRGFDPAGADPDGFGLRSMRDRAEAVGGRLTVASSPGCGTRLVAAVPMESGS